MVAALAVRSVAPRLRDPCASVRPSGHVDAVCSCLFFASSTLEGLAFFGLGRVRESLEDVPMRDFVLLSRLAKPASLAVAIDSLVFRRAARRPKAELLAQRLREVCICARECRLQQTRLAASL